MGKENPACKWRDFFAKSFAELSLKILVLKTLIQYICAGN